MSEIVPCKSIKNNKKKTNRSNLKIKKFNIDRIYEKQVTDHFKYKYNKPSQKARIWLIFICIDQNQSGSKKSLPDQLTISQLTCNDTAD